MKLSWNVVMILSFIVGFVASVILSFTVGSYRYYKMCNEAQAAIGTEAEYEFCDFKNCSPDSLFLDEVSLVVGFYFTVYMVVTYQLFITSDTKRVYRVYFLGFGLLLLVVFILQILLWRFPYWGINSSPVAVGGDGIFCWTRLRYTSPLLYRITHMSKDRYIVSLLAMIGSSLYFSFGGLFGPLLSRVLIDNKQSRFSKTMVMSVFFSAIIFLNNGINVVCFYNKLDYGIIPNGEF